MASVVDKKPDRRTTLLKRVTCPHCWEQFSPEATLWVSEHSNLLGDPLLGPEEPQRFLPTRFTVEGDARDAEGFPCHTLACPRCHLVVPRALLEMEPLFMSIFGAPASGKSFLLASMTWQLRQQLGRNFAISFSDADPVLNRHLNEYEESLFLNPQPGELTPLASLIRKTEEQGELYDTVTFGTQTVTYPRPFLLVLRPENGHPNSEKAERLSRVVCLYDNAGESFQPGRDVVGSPVTRHMAHSRTLFFVFDPTQDNRFRERMTNSVSGPIPSQAAGRVSRQEPVLQEAIARIRRYARMSQTEKHNRPLVVILTKYDTWSHLLSSMIDEDSYGEPWLPAAASTAGDVCMHALDVPRIERYSAMLRTLLQRTCPEIVSAAEGFAREVVYIPASAVGWSTQTDSESGLVSIRPTDTRPFWVTVPFLYAIHRWTPGLIPGLKRKESSR